MTGEELRRLRQQRGWSQAELARRAHLSRQHLNSLERGHNQIGPRAAQHLRFVLAGPDQLAGVAEEAPRRNVDT